MAHRDTQIEVRYALKKTPLGWAVAAATARGLCALRLGERSDELLEELRAEFPLASRAVPGHRLRRLLDTALAQLARPGAGRGTPLDPRGTPFQLAVWRELCKIPSGSTASYRDLAKRLGQPTAVRAVAGACAANPIAVIVPCHRIVRSDGSLGGYRWGLNRKRALLAAESRLATQRRDTKGVLRSQHETSGTAFSQTRRG